MGHNEVQHTWSRETSRLWRDVSLLPHETLAIRFSLEIEEFGVAAIACEQFVM
jgi:hypothetical protein